MDQIEAIHLYGCLCVRALIMAYRRKKNSKHHQQASKLLKCAHKLIK